MPFAKASLSDTLPQRRRLSRWALQHAWKLAGLTALVTFTGVFMAVSLSLVLRPTRSYFFPLLSDVSKHQPEGAILRLAFVAATALLFATTTASVLHCHSLRLFAQHVPAPPNNPLPLPLDHDPPHSPAPTARALDDPAPQTPPTLVHLDRHHDDAPPLHHAHHAAPHAAPPLRRRSLRLTTTQAAALALVIATALLTSRHLRAAPLAALASLRRVRLVRLLFNVVLYATLITWALAMCFLIWYFLKLQTVPDRPAGTLPTTTPPAGSPGATGGLEPDDAESTQTQARLGGRLRALATWVILILRPICLTGQAVCLIKIVGLWLALDTFSISNIRLVKIALLAALAFAEYTAAFFFAFFMTILAVDMRAKAPPPDLLT